MATLILALLAPAAALLPSLRANAPVVLEAATRPVLVATLPTRVMRAAAAGSAALAMLGGPLAAEAVETPGGAELPPDSFVVGFAFLLVLATGLLNLSLGDIAADEVRASFFTSALAGSHPPPVARTDVAGAAAFLRESDQ